MLVSLTFDVEQDCPPYLNTTLGVEKGLPRILDLLEEYRVKGTFFFTAKIARKYPSLVKRVVEEGHELGCHGYNHERLDKLSKEEAVRSIIKSMNVLREFDDIMSFRAPNLQLPSYLYSTLKENGILVDSSKARYKGYTKKISYINGVLEVPTSITSSLLRLPWRIQRPIHDYLNEPKVYFAHPWEFVSMKNVRFDCRFNTGNKALELLKRLIEYYKNQKAEFILMRDYPRIY
ncbi:polysaccharide deacetylase family protein [Thermococcus stetteri]|uniref:polysaccharide deacetylase family protein n=1 Tax=Thermococcus stetteri TaxID=49900 RepID=UPI001AEACFF2|nr:polysaccharide deacetylase family protein [Thermococcus stetteri]MBP1913017.1 peptidoglycan/xylan/chitin deacetylase (PgdA/CDA1 family) [Thermococcus stetteri]